MRILLVTKLNENRQVFEKAWNILRETFPMPTTSLSGVYISEHSEEKLSNIYTAKDLKAYKDKRSQMLGKPSSDMTCAMFNLVIVVGELDPEDTKYLSLCMHQMLIENVLMIDVDQPNDEAKMYYPMITWSKHTQSLNDEKGMAVDIAQMFSFMPDPKFSFDDVIKEFPGKFRKKHMQSAS